MKKIRENRRDIIVILILVVNSILFSMGSLFCPLSNRLDFNDSAIYQYIGYLISQGKVPYVDVFDHKGIYFYFINTIRIFIITKSNLYILNFYSLLYIELSFCQLNKEK